MRLDLIFVNGCLFHHRQHPTLAQYSLRNIFSRDCNASRYESYHQNAPFRRSRSLAPETRSRHSGDHGSTRSPRAHTRVPHSCRA